MKSVLKKWILYRGLATLVWSVAIFWPEIHHFLPSGMIETLSDSDMLLLYQFLALVLFAVLLVKYKMEPLGFVTYIIFFPAVIFPALCVYYSGLSLRLLLSLAKRGMAPLWAVPSTAVMIMGWLLLPRIHSGPILLVMSIVWVVAAVLSLGSASVFALRPLQPLAAIAEKIEQAWSGFVTTHHVEPAIKASGTQQLKKLAEANEAMVSYYTVSRMLDNNILPKLNGWSGRRVSLMIFVGVFTVISASLIASYATGYRIVSALEPQAFSEQSNPHKSLGGGEALYLSISVLTTSGISSVAANSSLSRTVVALEALSGFALITLLVVGFSLAFEGDIVTFQERLEKLSTTANDHLVQWKTRLNFQNDGLRKK